MTEQISALMDGELPPDAAGRETAQLRTDGKLREVWCCYHLIGDVMRGDRFGAYESRVVQKLADEPTVLAPHLLEQPRAWRYALSAAASVAGVALVVWTLAPTSPRPDMQMARTSAPAAVRGVENYLLAHQRYSPSNAMQGVAPYVRTVSAERKKAAP